MLMRDGRSDVCSSDLGAVEMISGVATAGIPQGVLVAQDLGLLFTYVRGSSKDRGRQHQIDGEVVSGQRDRQSVGLGKSVSVRVDLGGRRIIKKKNNRSIYIYRLNNHNNTLKHN